MLKIKEVGSKLQHLSKKEIKELMDRYYSGEKVIDLINEYGIEVRANKLYKEFPVIVLENKNCKYCDINLIMQPNPKSRPHNGLVLNGGKCPNCLHVESKNCDCINCNKLRLKEKNRIKKKIEELYGIDKTNPEKYNELSLESKIFLGAYLKNYYDFDNGIIEHYGWKDNKLFESRKEDLLKIKQLLDKRVIKIHPMTESDFL